MSIRKKGSRKITINGVTYLWQLRDNHCDMTVVVQLQDEGQILKKVFGIEEMFEKPMTPSRVEKFIKQALSEGWKPESRGLKTFFLKNVYNQT